MTTGLTIAVLILKILAALVTRNKEAAQQHAQKIVDHLGDQIDKANKQATEAEVRAASAEAKSDAKDRKLADFERGGKL